MYKCKVCGDHQTSDFCIKCQTPICVLCQVFHDEDTPICEACSNTKCSVCKCETLLTDISLCEICSKYICLSCVGFETEGGQVMCIECERTDIYSGYKYID